MSHPECDNCLREVAIVSRFYSTASDEFRQRKVEGVSRHIRQVVTASRACEDADCPLLVRQPDENVPAKVGE